MLEPAAGRNCDFFLDLQLVKLAVFVTHQGDELLGEVKAYETGA